MSLTRRLLCAVLLATGTLAGASARPNIILITLDTVRADRMGFLGSNRGLTPNLDALARQSVVFTRAYSQVPLTPPSHATILTGTYPQFHKVDGFDVPLAKDLPYAPEILRTNGYRTRHSSVLLRLTRNNGSLKASAADLTCMTPASRIGVPDSIATIRPSAERVTWWRTPWHG